MGEKKEKKDDLGVGVKIENCALFVSSCVRENTDLKNTNLDPIRYGAKCKIKQKGVRGCRSLRCA